MTEPKKARIASAIASALLSPIRPVSSNAIAKIAGRQSATAPSTTDVERSISSRAAATGRAAPQISRRLSSTACPTRARNRQIVVSPPTSIVPTPR